MVIIHPRKMDRIATEILQSELRLREQMLRRQLSLAISNARNSGTGVVAEYNERYAHPFEWTWTNQARRWWFVEHTG
jgi:hypothetical protein